MAQMAHKLDEFACINLMDEQVRRLIMCGPAIDI